MLIFFFFFYRTFEGQVSNKDLSIQEAKVFNYFVFTPDIYYRILYCISDIIYFGTTLFPGYFNLEILSNDN